MKITCKSEDELSAVLLAIPVAAYHLLILHDEECTPSQCNCNPEYILEDLTVENLTMGQKAQQEWIRSKTS